MRRWVVRVALVLAGVCAATAGATVTRYDASGTVLLNGTKIFPITLAKGPPRDGTTPSGADALNEVIGAGVNFLKVGPATTPWTSADIEDAKLWDQALAPRTTSGLGGAYTWINLSTLSQAQPGSSTDALLQQVITTLKGDPIGSPAIGMWKGADEPWWSGIPVSSLQFAYCLATTRGDPSWCANETPVDSDHLWVTIEAPKGTASDLAPYSAVTDTHGEDAYPININNSNPDLHQVGIWTSTIASITPNHSVWSTLQICSSGSYDLNGNFVLPTRTQERYMIYDAIINGARNLNFYGGNNSRCWNSTDSAFGWNWTFWSTILKSLIQEINASSPLAPALVNADSNQVLTTSDSTTEAISRRGSSSSEMWVLAARSGSGTQSVTISGLPSTITSGTVYTEGRSISVTNGSFTDTFAQWDVHVYHFTTSRSPAPGTASGTRRSAPNFTVTTPGAPMTSSFSPGRGRAGTSVTITGANFTGATSVAFNGAAASYSVNSGTQITAIVPGGATSGPISVTTPGGTATSSKSFKVR
jgi:hypothetical protein